VTILQAKSISVASCEHGTIHIYLLGADGEPFAIASMTVEIANAFVEEFLTEIEAVAAKTIGEPMGTA